MKEITIAFDVDGTLISNLGIAPETPAHMRPKLGLNLEAVTLLQLLSKMKNTKIIVWSGGGKEYAESVVRMYGLERFVDEVHGKHEYDESISGTVDIAFDDQHEFAMADKNLIVKYK